MEDGTSILFGLPGVAVDRVERFTEDGSAVRLVHVVTSASSAAGCPQCGVVSTSVRQYRTTRPRDLPYGEEPLAVRWHKRQYRCREEACERKAFTESHRRDPAAGPADRPAVPAGRAAGGHRPQRVRGRLRARAQLAGGAPALRRARRRAADRAGAAAGAGHR